MVEYFFSPETDITRKTEDTCESLRECALDRQDRKLTGRCSTDDVVLPGNDRRQFHPAIPGDRQQNNRPGWHTVRDIREQKQFFFQDEREGREWASQFIEQHLRYPQTDRHDVQHQPHRRTRDYQWQDNPQRYWQQHRRETVPVQQNRRGTCNLTFDTRSHHNYHDNPAHYWQHQNRTCPQTDNYRYHTTHRDTYLQPQQHRTRPYYVQPHRLREVYVQPEYYDPRHQTRNFDCSPGNFPHFPGSHSFYNMEQWIRSLAPVINSRCSPGVYDYHPYRYNNNYRPYDYHNYRYQRPLWQGIVGAVLGATLSRHSHRNYRPQNYFHRSPSRYRTCR